MNTSNKNIDDIIKESLSLEEAKFYDEMDEPSIFESFYSVFKGKNRWLTIYILIISLIILGLTVYSLIQFLETEIVTEILRWGVALIVGLLLMGFIKVYYWMEINKNIKLREMKRLELQLSLLTKKINNNNKD